MTQETQSQLVTASTRSLVFAGVLGAGLFAINLVLGGSLVYATGIPGLSAIVSGLFVPLVLSLSLRITGRPGAAAVTWLAYCLIAIPTPLNGPPGIYKVPIGLIAGLAFDVPAALMGGRKTGHYLGLVTFVVFNLGMFWLAFEWLDLPGGDAFRKAVLTVAAIFTVEGLISVTIAWAWYERRLSRIPRIQQLRH